MYDLATGQPCRRWPGPPPARDLGLPSRRDRRSRSLPIERESHMPDPRSGVRPPGSVDPAARRRRTGRLEPGRHHAGDARARMVRSTSGTPPPAPESSLDGYDQQRWPACGLPPQRHAAGQQRLGIAAAALGLGPGPARAELDQRLPGARIQPGRTNRRFVGGPIDHISGRSCPRVPNLCSFFRRADSSWTRVDPPRRPGAGGGHGPGRGALGPGPRHGACRSCRSGFPGTSCSRHRAT